MPTRSRGPWSLRPSFGTVLVAVAALACGRERETQTPTLADAPTDVCSGADRFSAVWNAENRSQLVAAIDELPGEWPDQLLASLDSRLPELGQRWADARGIACASESTGALRCLDGQIGTLDAVLGLIVEQPERAPNLWARLDRSDADPLECGSVTAEAGPELTPARGRELARVALLIELGEFDLAHAEIDALAADPAITQTPAHALALALARVSVELAAGRLEPATRALAEAESLASRSDAGARSRVAEARAAVLAATNDIPGAARAQLEAVEAARELDDPWLLIAQLDALGRWCLGHGEPEPAIAAWVEAIGLLGRVADPDHPRTAMVQRSLAVAQRELGQIAAAHDALTQARDTLVIALGPDHPQTLATVEDIARLLVAADRIADAQFAFLDLLEVYTDLYGVKHWRTALIKLELADTLMAVDEHASAQTLYTEALVPLVQEFGATDLAVVRTSIHLGVAELALGNLEAAATNCQRGRDLISGDHPLVLEADRCLKQIANQSRPKKRR